MSRALQHGDYTVGWISPMPIEVAAAQAMLDQPHPRLPNRLGDDNSYAFGRIGDHNVVIAGLPDGHLGPVSAALVAREMKQTFGSIRIGVLVGIGGGIPRPDTGEVRLGDVIVSKPSMGHGGVVHYDFGKALPNGGFQRTGSLNEPPRLLLSALTLLKAKREAEFKRYLSPIPSTLQPDYAYPGAELDRLFEAEYPHDIKNKTCDSCDVSRLVKRSDRHSPFPTVYYGTIATGSQVVSDISIRERLKDELNILCVETEAAGLMNDFPCIVIRGVSDYCDSHKNKIWYPYAALAAAAYTKEFLNTVPIVDVLYLSPVAAPSMAESFMVFSRHIVPSESVALGRLVRDLHSPWDDFCAQLSLTDADVAITPQRRVRELIESIGAESTIYNELNEVFRSVLGQQNAFDGDSLTVERAYLLLNSSHLFLKLCEAPNVREWLERGNKFGWDAYMIVGIQTVPQRDSWRSLNVGEGRNNAQTPLGCIAAGEQIVAIQYRKIRLDFSSEEELGVLELGE